MTSSATNAVGTRPGVVESIYQLFLQRTGGSLGDHIFYGFMEDLQSQIWWLEIAPRGHRCAVIFDLTMDCCIMDETKARSAGIRIYVLPPSPNNQNPLICSRGTFPLAGVALNVELKAPAMGLGPQECYVRVVQRNSMRGADMYVGRRFLLKLFRQFPDFFHYVLTDFLSKLED